ncbi:DUF3857 and transglutaminase domain-containing protein [Galbibacter sp. PAP.153]|uniref:DUF3857 and transglutaminase domain-containing protein n=1 Tax=Galbibacter sp. PAP.153 TaxID=3104623 RepID=UPI0030093CC0
MQIKSYLGVFFVLFNVMTAVSQEAFQLQSIVLNTALTKDANAIMRNDSISINIPSFDKMRVYKEEVVTILNKAGDKYASAYEYYSDDVKIKSVEAVIYDQMGNEIKTFKKRDFKDRSAVPRGTLYSDHRILYLDYTPTSYPYTIKFISEIETPNTVSIPIWYFVSGYNVSVEKSTFHINYGTDVTLRIKEDNLEGFNIQKTQNDNDITYSAGSIPAIEYEDLAPSLMYFIPKLQVAANHFNISGIEGHASNWEELGGWMYNKILTGRNILPDQTIATAKALVAGIDDPILKAKKIYEYVQEQTRYISVQIGIGGIQPIMAEEVDKVKYGDCKGLSNYTKALLEAVGVDAYYTHVEAGSQIVDFDGQFASLTQGNHAILAIPNGEDYCWIDCTSRVLPFNYVGDFTDNRKVLVMKPEGGQITTTVAYINRDNELRNIGEIELHADGSVDASVSITTKGVLYDSRFYLGERNNDDIVKSYKDYWHYINNLSLKQPRFKNDKENVVFMEDVSLSATKYASNMGDRMLVNINLFDRNTYVPARYKDRKMAFEVPRGFVYKDSIKINLPEGFEIEAMPKNETLESEFGSYALNLEKDSENNIIYQKEFFLKKGLYPKEKYADYRDFRKQISKLENAKIMLINKN